jgi:hypothetical protein
MRPRRLLRFVTLALLVGLQGGWAGDVLIVSDEHPQMEVLAQHLRTRANLAAAIVEQPRLPADLSGYQSVFVFIHGALQEPVEMRLIEYARSGGRLILLHHSISQAKGKNRYWFPFLGMLLRPGDLDQGGYKWIHGVSLSVVNLAPGNYITSHDVKYDAQVDYHSATPGGPQGRFPAFLLQDTEVFLNHNFTEGAEKTVLFGFRYRHEPSGVTYMQDRAGWYKPAGKGWVMYFLPGHTVDDLKNAAYSQILLNAVSARLP